MQAAYQVHGVTCVCDVAQLGGIPRRACLLLCFPANSKQDQDLSCFLNTSDLLLTSFLCVYSQRCWLSKLVGSEKAGGITAAGSDLSGMGFL